MTGPFQADEKTIRVFENDICAKLSESKDDESHEDSAAGSVEEADKPKQQLTESERQPVPVQNRPSSSLPPKTHSSHLKTPVASGEIQNDYTQKRVSGGLVKYNGNLRKSLEKLKIKR